mgnify:CR=1 FL=1
MAKLSWGKPRIFTFNADDQDKPNAYELPTPVEDSTELTPTKGDKLEAKGEGGDNEDVKYKRSTYAVTLNIRKKKGRKPPFPSLDGVVNDHYGLLLQPEDPSTEGFLIESNTIGIDDTFTAADGAIWAVTADAVKAETGNTVKWGVVTVNNNTVTFTERTTAGAEPYTRSWTLDETSQEGTAAGQESVVTYSEVRRPTGNPALKNYYERSGDGTDESPYVYTLSTDITVDGSKTYYVRD